MSRWALILLAFFAFVPQAKAQVIYDVPCPSGTTVINQAFNSATGHYKAYMCVDQFGNVSSPVFASGLSGTIAVNQVAFGSGVNTINGSSNFQYAAGQVTLIPSGDAVIGFQTQAHSATQSASSISNLSAWCRPPSPGLTAYRSVR